MVVAVFDIEESTFKLPSRTGLARISCYMALHVTEVVYKFCTTVLDIEISGTH